MMVEIKNSVIVSDIGTRVVAEAKTWLGTPYRHQATTRGAGTDCLGLVRGIWRAIHGVEPVSVPPYTQDWAEVDGDEVLFNAANALLLRRQGICGLPGDVLLFRMKSGGIAKHLGILSQNGPVPRFIHAYSGHGVVESALSDPWARRIMAVFSFPERVI